MRTDRVAGQRAAFEKNRKYILKTQTVCGICGAPVDPTYQAPHPLSATVDHIIPVSKGGHPSSLDNLQLAHRWCNRWKSDKTQNITFRLSEQENEQTKKDLPLHYDWTSYTASS